MIATLAFPDNSDTGHMIVYPREVGARGSMTKFFFFRKISSSEEGED